MSDVNTSEPVLTFPGLEGKHWTIKDFSVLLYANNRPFCGIIITVLQSSPESVKITHNKAHEREALSVV